MDTGSTGSLDKRLVLCGCGGSCGNVAVEQVLIMGLRRYRLVPEDEYECLRQIQFYARHQGTQSGEESLVHFLNELTELDKLTTAIPSEEQFKPEYLLYVAKHTLLPVDTNKRAALGELCHALEQPDAAAPKTHAAQPTGDLIS